MMPSRHFKSGPIYIERDCCLTGGGKTKDAVFCDQQLTPNPDPARWMPDVSCLNCTESNRPCSVQSTRLAEKAKTWKHHTQQSGFRILWTCTLSPLRRLRQGKELMPSEVRPPTPVGFGLPRTLRVGKVPAARNPDADDAADAEEADGDGDVSSRSAISICLPISRRSSTWGAWRGEKNSSERFWCKR